MFFKTRVSTRCKDEYIAAPCESHNKYEFDADYFIYYVISFLSAHKDKS